MNVLSLFDGMSCGQQALERAGIKVDNYFASEIDKYAIQVTMANYPNTKQLGSVVNVNAADLPKIDLLIGGSPCQSFSFAGKRKGMSTKDEQEILTLEHYLELKAEGFEFEGQSYLFWEFMRLLNETKPKYFLLENVKMAKKWEIIINKAIGINPILIDSGLVSAQSRKRLYWTNIPNIEQPKDKGILLKDIIEINVDTKFWYNNDFIYNGDNEKIQATLNIKSNDIIKRVYNLNNKCATLTCCKGGHLQKKVFQNGSCRKLTPLEYERLQTVKDNYTNLVSDSQRYNMLGNGWTVDVIAHIFKYII